MRILKINHNPTRGRTRVEYETVENDGADRVVHVLRSSDAPRPAMLKALDGLKEDVEALCGLPEGYVDSVRGVTIHEGSSDSEDAGDETVTYTATHVLDGANQPLVLNTPAVAPQNAKRLDRLLGEAKEYVKGVRAQESLPLSGETPAPKKQAPPRSKSKSKRVEDPEEV